MQLKKRRTFEWLIQPNNLRKTKIFFRCADAPLSEALSTRPLVGLSVGHSRVENHRNCLKMLENSSGHNSSTVRPDRAWGRSDRARGRSRN